MPNIPQLMTTAEVAEECGGVSVKDGHPLGRIRRPHARAETARAARRICVPPRRGRTVQVRTREADRMTDTQALIGLLAALALVPVVIACALVATRRDN
jgi:hypothetical protein